MRNIERSTENDIQGVMGCGEKMVRNKMRGSTYFI